LIAKVSKKVGFFVFLLVLGGAVWAASKTPHPGGAASAISSDKVVEAIRERFGIPDSTKMTAAPFHDSTNSAYYECVITVDDGKGQKLQTVSVSKDGKYLAMGSLYALGPDPKASIISNVHEVFKVPPTVYVTVGDFHDSTVPNFREAVVTADNGGKQKQTAVFYVTKDNRYVVMGNVFPLLSRSEILHGISTVNQPSIGSPHAPVTIVEYADLECPSCARMQEFLEKELLPKYGDKVRVIFKEFPLAMHEWASLAAIANECAYEISPNSFVTYRSMIFAHQNNINAANARDQLLTYGETAGVDRVKLATCMDSKASQPRVDKGLHEGQALGISSTPTFFINGKILVGVPPGETFYKAVDEALAATTTPSAAHQPKVVSRKQ